MEFSLEKIDKLCGKMATIYSIMPIGEDETLFDKFINEYSIDHKGEVTDIARTIKVVVNDKGFRHGLFKDKEGELNDGVIAFFDNPDKNLRLYGLRMGHAIVIIGSGGIKSKEIRALQEDPILTKEQSLLVALSKELTKRLIEKDIGYTDDKMELTGDLDFNIEYKSII